MKEAAVSYVLQKPNSVLNFSSFSSLSTEPLLISTKDQRLIPPVLAQCWLPTCCQLGQGAWAAVRGLRVFWLEHSFISEIDLDSSSVMAFLVWNPGFNDVNRTSVLTTSRLLNCHLRSIYFLQYTVALCPANSCEMACIPWGFNLNDSMIVWYVEHSAYEM